MASVPRYGDNTQRLEAKTGERLRAADFGSGGEAVGRAVEGFGQQIGQAAKAHEIVTEKYDEAAVRAADAEDAMEILKVRQSALSAKGIEAQSAIENANKEIEEIGRRRQASFSSNRQRSMYSDVFNRRALSTRETLGEHAIKQTEVAYQAGLDASIDSGTSVAVDSYADPVEFDNNLKGVLSAVEQKFKGMPEGVVSRAKAVATSNIHAKVVQSILNDPDASAEAALYLRKHAGQIEPETETQLYKMVNPFIDEERTAADASWAMSAAPAPDGNEHVDDEDYYATDPLAPTVATRDAKPIATAPPTKFVSPLRGVGSVSNTAAQHRARGSENGIDYAAPAGTPIYPPMSGKVKSNSWSEKGGWTVLVEHPNGMVTGYAHMRAKSALEVGEEVDRSTVLGGVGSTGKSTSNHLHFTVRKAGVKIDPATAAWSDANTVDPKSVAWKEDKLPNYSAEDTNLTGALDRLHQRATAEGWSARRYEKAATEVRQRGAVNQSLYADANRRLEDSVWGKFAEAEAGGAPITRIADLGPSFARLDGGAKSRVINMIQANKAALAKPEGIPANGDSYTTLAVAAVDPSQRAEFLRTNLDAIPDITPGERTRLKLKQATLRNDTTGVLAADIDSTMTIVNRYAPEAGFKTSEAGKAGTEDRRRRALLVDRTTALIEQRQQQLKRPLTDTEKDGIVRSQVVSIARDGETMPLYIARTTPKKGDKPDTVDAPATFNNIPPVVRSSIMAALQRRGIPVTPRNVIEAYLEGSR